MVKLDIMSQMRSEIIYRSSKSFTHRYNGPPTGNIAEKLIIGKVVADVDALAFGWEVVHIEIAASIDRYEKIGKLFQRQYLVAADIEDAPFGLWCRRCQKKRFDSIIDIREIASLFAAPHFEGLFFQKPAEPNADKGLPSILDAHARPIGIGETEDRSSNPVNIMIEDMVVLARNLVDTIHINGTHRMLFVRREIVGFSVDLACAGEDHDDTRSDRATSFQESELSTAVDLEVGERIGH